uniref:Uncharacterized protein n=1 Tax=Avena sativa TaxID=4498 RepID=A0ACD5YUX0_AVESA
MSTSASSSNTPLVVSKIAVADEGRHVVCIEFKQVNYHFNYRKYMCSGCGVLRSEHHTSKAKAKVNDGTGIREEHLPPRKRLMLRYKQDQKAIAAAAGTSCMEKKREGEESEEWEINWSPGATFTKGKRAPRRKRVDAS